MSPRSSCRYGRSFSYQAPVPPKINLFTSKWSPISSVPSIDADGILKACTMKLVPKSARITVTSSDSRYSEIVVWSARCFCFFSGACFSISATVSSGIPPQPFASARSSRSKALRAARCSASFFVPPSPLAMHSPSIQTSIWKTFSWSGPLSPATRYSAGACPRPCKSSCNADLRSDSEMRSPRSSRACSNRILRNTSRAAPSPPSRYTAATTASNASASSVCFSRPPVFSSPRPNRKCSPRRSRRAASSREPAFTIRARLLESCPSLHSGKAARRYSLVSSSRTASPRNSSRSLSRESEAETASSASAARNSGTAELCVSALSRSSLAENLYPRRSSNAPSAIRIVSCIIPPCRRPGSLRRAQLRRASLLRVIRLALAGRLHGPRHGRTLVEGRYRIIKVRRDLVRHPQQIVIHGVRIRIDLHSLLELRNRFRILPPPHVDQSQTAVGHRQRLILRGRKGFIGQVLGLRERWRNFNGLFGILLRFGEHLHGSGIGCTPTQSPRERLPQQRERRDIVRYDRDFLFAVFLHLLRVPRLQVGISQCSVHGRFVAALRIFLEKCFAGFNLFGGIIRIHGLKGLVRRIFFRIHRRRRVQRQRCSFRRLRFVALLRRRLALASLALLRALPCCNSARAYQQSRDGCRAQPDIPLLSHPFSPVPFLIHSIFVNGAASAPQPTRPGKNQPCSRSRDGFISAK